MSVSEYREYVVNSVVEAISALKPKINFQLFDEEYVSEALYLHLEAAFLKRLNKVAGKTNELEKMVRILGKQQALELLEKVRDTAKQQRRLADKTVKDC